MEGKGETTNTVKIEFLLFFVFFCSFLASKTDGAWRDSSFHLMGASRGSPIFMLDKSGGVNRNKKNDFFCFYFLCSMFSTFFSIVPV